MAKDLDFENSEQTLNYIVNNGELPRNIYINIHQLNPFILF